MKKISLGILLGLLVGLGVGAKFLRKSAPASAAEAPKADAPAGKPKENPLHLPAAKRAAARITLARAKSLELQPTVTAFGRVLDPSPLIGLIAELQTAQAALTASQQDADRAKKLVAAGANASLQSLEALQAVAARDRVAVLSAHARLAAAWGKPFSDPAALAKNLSELEKGSALVRLDLLSGESAAGDPKKARVAILGSTDTEDADIIGTAPTVDPQVQGVGYLAFVPGHELPVGASLKGEITISGDAQKLLVIPKSSIVYHEGSAWVYVLGEEDTFERKIVTLGRSLPEGIVIPTGIEEVDQVAITGAGQLLSAELQAGGAADEG